MQRISQTIDGLRQKHGDSLLILAHHYQEDSVVAHADMTGDSLELARQIPLAENVQNIVFCGVHFMAESAAILATPEQRVFLPEASAGCVMSNMAPASLVETMLTRLNSGKRRVIPLAYVNSSAAVKGVCGKFRGSVCTSANSSTMLSWALDRGDAVLFLPDQNLGLNTANILGIPQNERLRLNVRQKGALVDVQAAEQAKLILWPGCCAVHHLFKCAHINQMRKEHPDAQIIVHPECTPDVVEKADAAGSTSAIIKFVEKAPMGSTIIVGTEISLVDRLTERYAPDKKILPLARCQCSNMAKTTEEKLLQTLNALQAGRDISVKDTVRTPARLALQRMLDACN
ncbi:MAG: quinolinate synthase NadA [Desulfovibrio sp.]|uniref:quinolinate synthase NadA n=1 Tax=Desulfovibrio sp. 7SRBS1 TaxID=3378064 RepID=UPI003B41D1F6